MESGRGEPVGLFCIFAPSKRGDVAQLVEHLVRNQGVAGSSPVFSTKKPNVGLFLL